MNDYANYYELANAITSLCISDYTKEMCKYYHTGKYKEEIYMNEHELLLFDRLEIIKSTVNKYGEENFYISFSG